MLCWTVQLNGPKRLESLWSSAVTVGHKVYCFEWFNQLDVHIFNTVSLCWKKLTPVTNGSGERHLEVPSRRMGHTAVLIEDTIYIWGGWPYCNKLYAFDVHTHTWSKPKVSGTVPEGRENHSACVLGKVMYVYGGCNMTGHTGDIYKLDTSTMVWSLINTRGTPPPASYYDHSATIIGTKMFVFGCIEHKDTISVFDTETNCWLSTTPARLLPEGRYDHSAFAYNGELYIFAGNTSDQTLNDLWTFNPESFSWKKVETKGSGPGPMCSMFCCVAGGHIILFGGYKDNSKPSDDLYILDMSPSLKTLCKLAVLQYGLKHSELPHDLSWELTAMTANGNGQKTTH